MDIKNSTHLEKLREMASSRSRPDVGGAERPAPGAQPQGAGADQVTLTSAARSLLTLNTSAGDAPVDKARVAALRAAVADGTYSVDTARLAQRLADLEKSL